MDGWRDGWMDGWMDGRTDGRMDGWTDGYGKVTNRLWRIRGRESNAILIWGGWDCVSTCLLYMSDDNVSPIYLDVCPPCLCIWLIQTRLKHIRAGGRHSRMPYSRQSWNYGPNDRPPDHLEQTMLSPTGPTLTNYAMGSIRGLQRFSGQGSYEIKDLHYILYVKLCCRWNFLYK